MEYDLSRNLSSLFAVSFESHIKQRRELQIILYGEDMKKKLNCGTIKKLVNYLCLCILTLITCCIFSRCDVNNNNGNTEIETFTNEIHGYVYLENQSEHSNALVYLDSLDRGVCTDSTGYYSILFSERDSLFNGILKIFFFLVDYELDSAQVVLYKGKVKLDTLGVDSEGTIETKDMKQIFSVIGWTDKQVYNIGDSISFAARYTNLTDGTLYFINGGDTSPLGWVTLYNENYRSIILNPHDPYGADLSLFLNVGEVYEASGIYILPEQIYYDNPPLIPGQYLVKSGIHLYNDYTSIPTRINEFILNEWYNLHRGTSPKLNNYPNKYNFPLITVNE